MAICGTIIPQHGLIRQCLPVAQARYHSIVFTSNGAKLRNGRSVVSLALVDQPAGGLQNTSFLIQSSSSLI